MGKPNAEFYHHCDKDKTPTLIHCSKIDMAKPKVA
jgi:hypothetical protein